jgi:tetratricopeptide (TPR) repeat protein
MKRIAFLAIILGAASVIGRAQVGPDNRPTLPPFVGSISGRVLLPSGQSTTGVIRVTLTSDRSPQMTAIADDHGAFTFTINEEGTYYVRASSETALYEPATEAVVVTRISMNRLTIYLREKGASATKKPAGATVSAGDLDANAPSEAKKEYNKAAKLIEKGDSQKAIESLARAIAIYPDYLMARNQMGVQYLKLRRFREAAEQFQAVIERNPKSFNARLNLGLVRIEEKDYKMAVSELTEAASIDSGRPDAHMWLGVAFLQAGELAGAERELKRTVELDTTEQLSIAHYYFAHTYLRQGQRDLARSELNAYLKQSPLGDRAEEARALLQKLK